MAKKVAVLGAGASGLCGIKCCLEEGLTPVCFEQTDRIGGLWYYDEELKDDVACVMKTTVINTSKEMMCYSDFPIPGNFPNFMHNTKVIEYFKLYADNFNLTQHVRFNTKVVKIRPVPDFQETGRWEVEYKGKNQDSSQKEIFDAVLLCSGHHTSKQLPSFPGSEQFSGKQVHTHDYRSHEGYEDKRVVVVGIGNSGGDVAVELSKISKQVYLSTRRGAWVGNRVSDNGMPVDMQAIRRSVMSLVPVLPRNIVNYIAETKLNSRFNHSEYGLQPEHRFDAQHPMINDELPNRIASGTVIVKPDVSKITKTGVEFDNGTTEEDIDVIIYATGYKFGFPFLDHPGFEVKNNVPHLYKYVFAPDMPHQTIAAIGFFQPLGAIMPISELQCRCAVRVFKGLVKLPSKDVMEKDIAVKAKLMAERYVASPRHTIQVDWIPFMDELAEMVGCKPDILTLFFQDVKLALNVMLGPCTPYQFRLFGPGSWSGARRAIMTQWDRTSEAMKTRPVPASTTLDFKQLALLFLVAAWILRSVLFFIL